MGHVRRASPAQRRHAAAMRRDGALARLSTVTGAIGVATVAAVGILGVYVGKALPGHHAAPATGTTATSGGGSQVAANQGSGNSGGNNTGNNNTGGNSGGNSGNSGQGAINPSSTPTQGTSIPPPVTSGSS